MENISLNFDKTLSFISKDSVLAYKSEIETHNKALFNKTGKGNDFLGWTNLPLQSLKLNWPITKKTVPS
jgi:glucose-6-phosphate isomerase